jgi:hypothetical protein
LLADSVQVTPPDVLAVGPTLLRGSDAQSVFTAHDDVLYAARSTVAAEQRILSGLEDADAPLIPADELAASIARVPLGETRTPRCTPRSPPVHASPRSSDRPDRARPTCTAPSPPRGRPDNSCRSSR